MPIKKQVEVCGYNNVTIENKEIIEDLEEKDARIVIEGLLKKFPKLMDSILLFTKKASKIYPEPIKEALIQKYKKENKPITSF